MRDTWLIFRRHMLLSLRNPAWVLLGILQPVLYLGLFGPLLEPIVENTPGFPPGEAALILTPALMIMTGLFGGLFVGFALLADLRNGVLERMRVTPVSRLALLLGRVAHDAVQLLVQAILLVLLAYLIFGITPPIGGVLLALVIVALVGVTLSSCSYAVALVVRSEEVFPQVLNMVALPLLLLSGILLPITAGLAPDWLYTISRYNPFTYVVEAERASFRGEFTMDALFTGSVVVLVLAVLGVLWGVRTFRKENA